MNTTRRIAVIAPVAIVLALGATSAFAGTTGTEFQTMYTTLLNWATGYLGKAIAVAAFILGAGIGVARSSPVPALAGVVFALFMVYVPTILDSIMKAIFYEGGAGEHWRRRGRSACGAGDGACLRSTKL